MVNATEFRARWSVVVLAALVLTAAAWLRGAEYDEQYTLFLTAGVPRPDWPETVFPAGSVAAMQAGHATLAGIARDLRTTDVHPPLYFWGVSLWRSVFGSGLFAARMFSVVCGVVSIWMVGAIGRRCEVRPALAMLLTLGCYGFVYTNAIARGFACAGTLILAGVALLLGRRPLLAGVCLGAACCCNYLAVFVAAAIVAAGGGWLAVVTAAPFLAIDAWFFAAQHAARTGQFPPFEVWRSLVRLAEYQTASVFGGLPLYVDGIARAVAEAGVGVLAVGLVVSVALRRLPKITGSPRAAHQAVSRSHYGVPGCERLRPPGRCGQPPPFCQNENCCRPVTVMVGEGPSSAPYGAGLRQGVDDGPVTVMAESDSLDPTGAVLFGRRLRWPLCAGRAVRVLLAGAVATPVGLLLLGAVFDNTPIELRYLSFGLSFIGLLIARAVSPVHRRSATPIDTRSGVSAWAFAVRSWLVIHVVWPARPLLLPLILAIQLASIAGLLWSPRTMQPARAVALEAARLAGDGIVLVPRGNDGVGIVGAFGIEAPPSLPLLLVRPTDSLAAHIAPYHRVVLALLAQDRDSTAAARVLRAAFAAPNWRCAAIGSNLNICERTGETE